MHIIPKRQTVFNGGRKFVFRAQPIIQRDDFGAAYISEQRAKPIIGQMMHNHQATLMEKQNGRVGIAGVARLINPRLQSCRFERQFNIRDFNPAPTRHCNRIKGVTRRANFSHGSGHGRPRRIFVAQIRQYLNIGVHHIAIDRNRVTGHFPDQATRHHAQSADY